MTTTSTTGYIDIDSPSVYSYTSTVQAPPLSEMWSTLQGLDFKSSPNKRAQRRRRLQKPRRGLHVLMPADPREVLARPAYNHVTEQTKSSPSSSNPPEALHGRHFLKKFKSLPKLPLITPFPKSATPPIQTLSSGSPATSPSPSQLATTENMVETPVTSYLAPTPARRPSHIGDCGCPPLRRQKSMAKVVLDGVGRLTSKCRPARSAET